MEERERKEVGNGHARRPKPKSRLQIKKENDDVDE